MAKSAVSFTVPGSAIPKQSFRARLKPGRGYQSARVKTWQNEVGWYARIAMSGGELFAGELAVKMIFYLPDNRRRDLDNLAKGVGDAMHGIVYRDDSQICDLQIHKHLDRENPRVSVEVRER